MAAVAEEGISVDSSSFVRYDTDSVKRPRAVGTAPARTVLNPSPSMWVLKGTIGKKNDILSMLYIIDEKISHNRDAPPKKSFF